jgi:hypothetical protein
MVYIGQLELVISLTRHLDKFYDRDADATVLRNGISVHCPSVS